MFKFCVLITLIFLHSIGGYPEHSNSKCRGLEQECNCRDGIRCCGDLECVNIYDDELDKRCVKRCSEEHETCIHGFGADSYRRDCCSPLKCFNINSNSTYGVCLSKAPVTTTTTKGSTTTSNECRFFDEECSGKPGEQCCPDLECLSGEDYGYLNDICRFKCRQLNGECMGYFPIPCCPPLVCYQNNTELPDLPGICLTNLPNITVTTTIGWTTTTIESTTTTNECRNILEECSDKNGERCCPVMDHETDLECRFHMSLAKNVCRHKCSELNGHCEGYLPDPILCCPPLVCYKNNTQIPDAPGLCFTSLPTISSNINRTRNG